MGNSNKSNSKTISSNNFNIKQWTVVDRSLQSFNNQSKGNYKILSNIKTNELIDQYEMIWPSYQDYQFYLESFMWRKNQYNIVESKYILEEHTQQFCSKTYQAKIYIQHIQTRLSDITDIPYPDNLYVILSCLQGYQKLYQNLHYFLISQDQICVDKQGIVKVWVNSNLSKNYPQTDLISISINQTNIKSKKHNSTLSNLHNELNNNSDKKDQTHMVQELMNMIWENTDQQSQPVSFSLSI